MPRRVIKVVVVLPKVSKKILFQLRDQKKDISFPGHWGFFGGAIEKNETPETAVKREIKEELGFAPNNLKYHGIGYPFKHLKTYIFSFKLAKPLSKIKLHEGMDFALICLEDLKQKKFYSEIKGKMFNIIPLPFIENTTRMVLKSRRDI